VREARNAGQGLHEATPQQATSNLRYDPFGSDRDCGDFDIQAEAQAFYEVTGDPHRLD